jgi:parallel beta helix pectate lyase-like protein
VQSARSANLEEISMNRTAIVIAAGLALAASLPVAPARAQFFRTFVSGTDNDSNPCTRTQPCLTFAGALAQTNAGGEIDVLDPGGYDPVTINKAISIINNGVGTVGVRALPGADAITINAGASDQITLRGLTIQGAGTGASGIVFNTGASLTVQNCVIRGFTNAGIAMYPNSSSNFLVSNTSVGDNGAAGIIVLPTGSGTVNAVFNRVEAYNNYTGIAVSGQASTGIVNATLADSMAANNYGGGTGFVAVTGPGQAPTRLMVFRSVAANNDTGIGAQGLGATLRIGQSTVTGNAKGWLARNSGVVLSYGDNKIDGNAGNQGTPPSNANQ